MTANPMIPPPPPQALPAEPSRLRLETLLGLSAALLTIVVALALAVVYIITTRQSLRLGFSERLRDVAGLTAARVDGSLHAGLLANNQKFSDDYNTIRDGFLEMQEAAPDIASIYTIRRVGERAVFVVDAHLDPADIHTAHLNTSGFARTQFDAITAPTADTNFNTNQWGTFLSGYAPIYNAQGDLDAILVVEMDAAIVTAREGEVLTSLLVALAPLLVVLAAAGYIAGRLLTRSISRLGQAARRFADGDLGQRVRPGRGWAPEVVDLADSFNEMADRLEDLLTNLEKRVADRTQESNRRTEYVEAASEVAAVTSSIMDSERLVRQVVELIRTRFDLYYVGLFLVDARNEWALLQAGTGDAGERMIARGHRIEVGQGMIGWSIANAQPRIALEAGADQVRLATSELPLTRSEAAIPLRSRGRVLGALSVQSTRPGAFDQSLLLTFQTMADQVAVALDNARLLDENQAALEAAQRTYRQLTQRGWLDFLQLATTARGYTADAQGVAPLAGGAQPGPAKLGVSEAGQVALPVRVRGLDLGRIVATKPEGTGEWRSDEIEMMQDFVSQISAALENARLYSETQRSAQRERILSDITAVVRSSTSVDAILQNAVKQLAGALNVPQAAIRLHTAAPAASAAPAAPADSNNHPPVE